jgi:hypothetical protein
MKSKGDMNSYINKLAKKQKQHLEKYEQVEVKPRNRNLRIRITSDIEQLDWRMRYLRNIERNIYFV